jgi:hypothetical protein
MPPKRQEGNERGAPGPLTQGASFIFLMGLVVLVKQGAYFTTIIFLTSGTPSTSRM